MNEFSRRAHTPELMDGPCTYEEFRACLHDLARVNKLTLAYGPTLGFLNSLPRQDAPLRIVDVGSGYGDMLRRVARWAAQKEIAVDLTGIDLNPYSARAASEVTAIERGIKWVTADAFGYMPEKGVDVVISSLFTHHLQDAEVVRFLRWMQDTARVGWFVNDLHRARLPHAVFSLWSRMAGWHRFVQNDGPVSITRAFTTADWTRLCDEAGLSPQDVTIRWRVPYRLCVAGRKHG